VGGGLIVANISLAIFLFLLLYLQKLLRVRITTRNLTHHGLVFFLQNLTRRPSQNSVLKNNGIIAYELEGWVLDLSKNGDRSYVLFAGTFVEVTYTSGLCGARAFFYVIV
jgi:hypothetical protein